MNTHSLSSSADYVIVGAGIMGLSIAYHLAKLGVKHIVVLDQGYLCNGASGRNGGGVRAQWSSETNIRLMQESIRVCEDFASEMKINVWFRQGGYLFLAHSEARKKALETSVALQQKLGLKTELLSHDDVRRIVPELNISEKQSHPILAASYHPNDGVVFPWPFVWGYAQAAHKFGVEIYTHTKVIGFETSKANECIEAVRTTRGRVATHCVINAAGAWSPEIAAMLNVYLPNRPHRHEICSTEPLKPWLKPLVADLDSGLYFSQSMRGEIVGGISDPHVPDGINHQSSWNFASRYAKNITQLVPVLREVKLLRQWAGCYDITPDANPIVGFVDEIKGFYQASGFMGHGFMMAPIMGKYIAEHIMQTKPPPVWLEQWNLRRFREGKLLNESMIIG